MIKYYGEFKTKHDSTISVQFIPNGDITDTVELKFAFENPITITQNSEGLFSPIKTKSATFRIFTDTIYWDLYTKSSTDYYVEITKDGALIFDGFITPCIYSQDYTYNGIIEIEAVDTLAVLDTIKYTPLYPQNGKGVYSIHGIINNIINKLNGKVAGYYLPNTIYRFYYLQESNFFDDDDEPMTCKEVLEEIAKYLGFTFISYNSFWIGVDYTDTEELITTTLNTDQYKAGTPTIELDDVYNKISINCDLYEVDELTTDIKEEPKENELKKYNKGIYSLYPFQYRMNYQHTTEESRYNLLCKPYLYKNEGKWKILRDGEVIENDVSYVKDSDGNWVFTPFYESAYPIKYKTYSNSQGLEDADFEDAILIRNSVVESKAVIKYEGDEQIPLSIQGGTSYIVINNKIFLENRTNKIKDGADLPISAPLFKGINSVGDEIETITPVPLDMDGIELSPLIVIGIRKKDEDEEWNLGFDVLKTKLKVGDKYWNGTQWTTTESTFYLRYHDRDMKDTKVEIETLSAYKWVNVLRNPNIPKYDLEKDGYAIPITENDKVCGKIEITFYNNYYGGAQNDALLMFIKNIKVNYAYNQDGNWADDKDEGDDIVYENVINNDYALEFSDMDIKINSWYENKPVSKSYILDNNKLPIKEINGYVQERRLVDMYYNHYSTPKKILNLNYRKIPTPYDRYFHPYTNTYYCVDSYELDLINENTRIKMIEI